MTRKWTHTHISNTIRSIHKQIKTYKHFQILLITQDFNGRNICSVESNSQKFSNVQFSRRQLETDDVVVWIIRQQKNILGHGRTNAMIISSSVCQTCGATICSADCKVAILWHYFSVHQQQIIESDPHETRTTLRTIVVMSCSDVEANRYTYNPSS